jgi:hypothetical protein
MPKERPRLRLSIPINSASRLYRRQARAVQGHRRQINATPHTGYAEAFVGMGGVFLKRTQKPKTEVINDRNGEVANLFRILQRHYPQFMETLKFQITSRREFQRLVACDPSTLTDLERAARFLYLQRLSFGGKVTGRSFGVDKDGGGRFNVTRLGPVLGGHPRAHGRRRHRAARLARLAQTLGPARHAVLSRSSLLRERGRLWRWSCFRG